jgi:ABC-type sugar transport system ATPase subunit
MNQPTSLVSMRNITKRYGGVQALERVNLEVRSGEIVCLLGENGAGKSTLMKVLAGVVTDFEGELFWEGAPVQFSAAAQARELGIGVVFQEFNLCPNLSAAENIFLGREQEPGGRLGWLNRAAMRSATRAVLAQLNLDLDVDLPVSVLGMARQQMVEIARALSENPRLLILDEPTSALSNKEVESFFIVLKALKARGLAIVYISHKLSEIREICDRVVCLRDGENAGEADPRKCSEDDLVAMMVGRVLEPRGPDRRLRSGGSPVLSVKGLSGPPFVQDISFDLGKGEILGFAGLMGAGRTELARLLMGVETRTKGEVLLSGHELAPQDPHDALEAGMAYVPEDRKTQGLVSGLTVGQHIHLSSPFRVARANGFFRRGRRLALSRLYIRRLRIKATTDQQAFHLSGGNQQKVILARCLASRPKVLILDEPTRGIDVGAKAEVHRLILELASQGMAVILISSELPELLLLSSRLLVMRQGRVTAELSREQFSEETVMRAAVG